MKALVWIPAALLFLSCAIVISAQEAGLQVSQDKPYKVKSKGGVVRIQDKSKPIRTALEEQYEKTVTAYFQHDPETVLALHAPNFMAKLPNGQIMSAEDSEAYIRAGFEQVKRNLHLSFDIMELTAEGDTAIATIHQQWRRLQMKGDQLRTVETEAIQREWWLHTPEGWRLFFVDDVHPGVWKVDGKRIDPSKAYDPAAPEFHPELEE